MALKGSLTDLGVVDLLQFPHTGRKTGELVITGHEQQARLFYDQGKMVHAFIDNLEGMEALVELVGWTQGDFEFQIGGSSKTTSIKLDLHRAVMQALKTRDEQRQQEKMREAEQAGKTESDASDELSKKLSHFLAKHEFANYACILDSSGTASVEVFTEDGPPEGVSDLQKILRELVTAYPRPGLRRVMMEEQAGTVVLSRLGADRSLVVVADKCASLGAVSIGVAKMAGELDEGTS